MSSSEHAAEVKQVAKIEHLAELSQQVWNEKDVQTCELELEHSKLGGYVPVTDEEKKQNRALNHKLDLFVLPFAVMIYLMNGLDRSNLGNAETDGFTKDLGLPSTAINTAISFFFCTFVPLSPISAVIGKRVGQTKWLTFISLGWGISTFSQAFVKTEAQLIAIRLLIGVFESGFYATCVSYLSTFYPRFDMAFRIAIFFSSIAVAGAFGGLIAYGCFHIDGSLYGWQYLFIIEGCLTIALGLVTPFWLAVSPGSAWFLNETERRFADKRMVIDSAANLDSTYKLTKRDIKEGILDWKLWCVLPFNVLSGIAPAGFTIFFPIVVKGLGYPGPTANLMTVPPYLIGTICLLCVASSSDHFHERTLHILGGLLTMIIGLTIVVSLPLENVHGRYGGLVILLAGTFIAPPITVAWLCQNTPEPGKRTLVLGINTWGNLAGIIGSELYLSKYGPDYHWPLKITLGCIAAAFVGFVAYHFELKAVNKYKAKKISCLTLEEIKEESRGDKRYADRKWTFVYGT